MTPAARPLAIDVHDLSKAFRIPREQVHTLKERVLHPLRRPVFEQLQALKDVSFDVRQGEFFGIVGRNGSGKSTLLKCLAGIYRTDHGTIDIGGRISAFIELGVGFNVDLPARDNIVINATMLGLTQREARARTDAVLDFAELGEFVDLKLKNYSSGMLVRLAFSVMIQVDADVLLIDEVLAVGDASFQQKCFDEFARLRRERRTVVLVTHEMGAVQRFCDRALLLERGHVIEVGEPREISTRYLRMNFERGQQLTADGGAPVDAADAEQIGIAAATDRPANPGELRAGDGRAEIVGGWFTDHAGEEAESLQSGLDAAFHMHVRFHDQVADPVFALALRTSAGEPAFVADTYDEIAGETFAPGEEIVVTFTFPNLLTQDRYGVSASVARRGYGEDWHDNRETFRTIMVTATRPRGGLAELPVTVALARQDTGEAAGA